MVFELALDEILLQEERSAEVWRWEWPRRPEPPRSPVHRWRKAGFNDRATFQAKVVIGGDTVESEAVVLKVRPSGPAG